MGASGRDDLALGRAWSAYRQHIGSFDRYELQLLDTDELLLGRPLPPEDDMLEELADASEDVEDHVVTARWHADRRSHEADRLEDFAVAAAALDVHLAADIFRLAISADEWEGLAAESGLAREDLDSLVGVSAGSLATDDITRLEELVHDADAALAAGATMAGGEENLLPLQRLTEPRSPGWSVRLGNRSSRSSGCCPP